MAKPRSAKGRAVETMHRLSELYPGTARELCELDFDTPFQLLVATVLSAQTTDERVNSVTPKLFARFPSAADLAFADSEELEGIIHSTGFFRAKARNLIGLGRELEARFNGEVPTALDDLVTLPGVGRKTGNVIRSVAFNLPGLAVDTHVGRITRLLHLTESDDPVKVETDVCSLLPAGDWGSFGLKVILHGRRVCIARRPRCADCVLSDFCPSAFMTSPVKRAPTKPGKATKPAQPTNPDLPVKGLNGMRVGSSNAARRNTRAPKG